MQTRKIVVIASIAMLLGACSKKNEDTAVPEAAEPEPAVEDQYPDKNPEQASIIVDEKIMEMCDIPTAHFAFDSSALNEEAQTALDALAACFSEDGPAAGEGMRLVGHADPRGTEEYNMALGQRRAGSVAGYLEGKGLGDDKLETSSRGEMDATGTDEATWAEDRKVMIFLAE
jgi:peptidoglycan-associated lipoprotein